MVSENKKAKEGMEERKGRRKGGLEEGRIKRRVGEIKKMEPY